MAKKPQNKKERVEYLESQINDTMENLNEAKETLDHDNLPSREQELITAKNQHRKETMEGLKAEIEDELN